MLIIIKGLILKKVNFQGKIRKNIQILKKMIIIIYMIEKILKW